MKRPNPHHLLGKRFTDYANDTWQLVGYNDLYVPYFSKVVRGKVQVKRFTHISGDAYIKQWMAAPTETAQQLADRLRGRPIVK